MEWRLVAAASSSRARRRSGCGCATRWSPARSPPPLQRALVAADVGNGISAALDCRRFLFINVDLTVQLERTAGGRVGLRRRGHPAAGERRRHRRVGAVRRARPDRPRRADPAGRRARDGAARRPRRSLASRPVRSSITRSGGGSARSACSREVAPLRTRIVSRPARRPPSMSEASRSPTIATRSAPGIIARASSNRCALGLAGDLRRPRRRRSRPRPGSLPSPATRRRASAASGRGWSRTARAPASQRPLRGQQLLVVEVAVAGDDDRPGLAAGLAVDQPQPRRPRPVSIRPAAPITNAPPPGPAASAASRASTIPAVTTRSGSAATPASRSRSA